MLEKDFQERKPDFALNNQFEMASKVHRIVRTTEASTQESVASQRQKHEKRDQHGLSSVHCESTETLYCQEAAHVNNAEQDSSIYDAYAPAGFNSRGNAQELQM